MRRAQRGRGAARLLLGGYEPVSTGHWAGTAARCITFIARSLTPRTPHAGPGYLGMIKSQISCAKDIHNALLECSKKIAGKGQPQGIMQ
ncbi:unnamed protein product [Gadus morhua 'NCC']